MILVLGDVAVSAGRLAEELVAQGYLGGVLTHQWSVSDNEEMVRANRHHELHGPEGLIDEVELIELIAPHRDEITGIVTMFFPVSRQLMDELPSLVFIGTVRSGTQNIDLGAAAERGVEIYNNPGRNAPVVADFAVALMLATCRGVAVAQRALLDGVWLSRSARTSFRTLSSTPVGLVGFGQIGHLVARLLRGFECEVRVYDPYLRTDLLDGLEITRVGSLEELLAASEVVSLHARVTPETTGLIGEKELAALGPDGILVNTARAELIDEDALVAALARGSIHAAGLDVFSEEPLPPEHELRKMTNVTLTPHLAGASRDVTIAGVRLLARRLASTVGAALWTGNVAPAVLTARSAATDAGGTVTAAPAGPRARKGGS